MSDIHVIPVDDIIEHAESVLCWCRPVVHDDNPTRVVSHNSADGREYFEQNDVHADKIDVH